MFKVWDSRNYYFHSMSFGGSLNELWRENGHGGWATVFALIVILVWHCYKRFPFIFSSSNLTPSDSGDSGDSGARIHPQLKYATFFILFFSGFSPISNGCNFFHWILCFFIDCLKFVDETNKVILCVGVWWAISILNEFRFSDFMWVQPGRPYFLFNAGLIY